MKATIIGVGNLGGAIACGLAKGTFLRAEDITCVDSDPAALVKMKATGLPFNLTADIEKALPDADLVILAVKSHAVKAVIDKGHGALDPKKQIFFSVVAGMSLDELEAMMCAAHENPEGISHIHFRVMPNIAISIGESMTFISSRGANAAQIKLAEQIFGEMGQTMVIPEKLMPAAMAVGSCGTAYVMRYVRAAMTGAVEAGFTVTEAHTVVLQTIKGAIELLRENGEHPEIEIDRVITPGGYTIRGLNAMEERGFSNAVIAGIRESYKDGK